MPEKEILRTEFNQKIEQFIKEHHCETFQEFFDRCLRVSDTPFKDEFFTDPIIHGYLTRKSIPFVDKHPQLESGLPDNRIDSDFYELEIYRLFPNLLLYRTSNVNTDKFYTDTEQTTRAHVANFNLLFPLNTALYEIGPIQDTYQIAIDVTRRCLPTSKQTLAPFLINTSWHDDHATTCLSILNPHTKETLITLFINSWQNASYHQMLSKAFYYPQQQRISETNPLILDYFKEQFSIDLNAREVLSKFCKEIRIAKSGNIALIINADSQTKKELLTKYETVYEITHFLGFKLYLNQTPKAPFIDASHHIQINKDDGNCVLYSYKIILAIIDYLSDAKKAQHVLNLALESSRGLQTNEEAIRALQKIFQEDLKPFLPCYYDQNNSRRSSEELNAYHLKLRWDFGGEWFARNYPVRKQEPVEVFIETPRPNAIALPNYRIGKKTGIALALLGSGLFAYSAYAHRNTGTPEFHYLFS